MGQKSGTVISRSFTKYNRTEHNLQIISKNSPNIRSKAEMIYSSIHLFLIFLIDFSVDPLPFCQPSSPRGFAVSQRLDMQHPPRCRGGLEGHHQTGRWTSEMGHSCWEKMGKLWTNMGKHMGKYNEQWIFESDYWWLPCFQSNSVYVFLHGISRHNPDNWKKAASSGEL